VGGLHSVDVLAREAALLVEVVGCPIEGKEGAHVTDLAVDAERGRYAAGTDAGAGAEAVLVESPVHLHVGLELHGRAVAQAPLGQLHDEGVPVGDVALEEQRHPAIVEGALVRDADQLVILRLGEGLAEVAVDHHALLGGRGLDRGL
jgi:hypothetical protein